MYSKSNQFYNPWPELPYQDFQPTAYLLHMSIQAIGKLKLSEPFEPQWANVALWLTSRGLTTGPISYRTGTFTVDLDLIDHKVICATSWGPVQTFKLSPTSVADFTKNLFKTLKQLGLDISINQKPQEVLNPIPFDQDTQQRPYDSSLVTSWWHILMSTFQVLERYHARFTGKTPPIGLMWGTLDLRDARYKCLESVPTTGMNSGYIRRNAMNEAQIEVGWWHGNPDYTRPAYFSFAYPQPNGIENVIIKPPAAKWNASLGEFLLDYDDLRKSSDPEKDLLAFFESTYQAGAKLAGWEPKLIHSGKPI